VSYYATYYQGDPQIGAILYHWDALVKDYTSKILTFPLDRILAISALASEFGSVLDDVYLAGMWYCAFPACLFWTMLGDRHQRPRLYQGPSWSWVAVNGVIQMSLTMDPLFLKAKHFELVAYRIVLTNDLAPYGSLDYGHLMIRCRLKRGRMIHRKEVWMQRRVDLEMYPSTAEDDITDESTVAKGI
jgi:hypothetical protein